MYAIEALEFQHEQLWCTAKLHCFGTLLSSLPLPFVPYPALKYQQQTICRKGVPSPLHHCTWNIIIIEVMIHLYVIVFYKNKYVNRRRFPMGSQLTQSNDQTNRWWTNDYRILLTAAVPAGWSQWQSWYLFTYLLIVKSSISDSMGATLLITAYCACQSTLQCSPTNTPLRNTPSSSIYLHGHPHSNTRYTLWTKRGVSAMTSALSSYGHTLALRVTPSYSKSRLLNELAIFELYYVRRTLCCRTHTHARPLCR